MADEGKASEGQESEGPSMNDMIDQANAELQMAPPPPPESYGDWRAEIKANEGWVRAIAKDERGSKPVRASIPSTRSWQSRRASWRARVDAQRTEHALQRKVRSQWEKPDTSPPYAKGWIDQWWDRTLTRVFRWLGIE